MGNVFVLEDEPPLPEPPKLKPSQHGLKHHQSPYRRHGTIDDSRNTITKYPTPPPSKLVNTDNQPPELNTSALKNINVSNNALKNLLSKVSTPKGELKVDDKLDEPSGPKPNLLEVQQNRPIKPRAGMPNRRAGMPNNLLFKKLDGSTIKSIETRIESVGNPIPQSPLQEGTPIPQMSYSIPPPSPMFSQPTPISTYPPNPYAPMPTYGQPPIPPPFMSYPGYGFPAGGGGFPAGPPPPLPSEETSSPGEKKVIEYSGRKSITPEKEPEMKRAKIVDYKAADLSGLPERGDSTRTSSPSQSTMPDRLKPAHSSFSYDTFRKGDLDKLPSPPRKRSRSKERRRSDSKDRNKSSDRHKSSDRYSRSRPRSRERRSRSRERPSGDRNRRRSRDRRY